MNILVPILGYSLLAIIFAVFLLPAVLNIKANRERRREQNQMKDRVREAIDKITADGKVEGPKGPYVPRKRRGPMTDSSTSPPKHSGYYHNPWR